MTKRIARIPATLICVFFAGIFFSGCAVVRTTADVAKTTVGVASTVVGTTASVGKAVVEAGVTAGSATVSAASAAKSVTLATASVAISGASMVGSAVMWGMQMKKNDEFMHAPVTSLGSGLFQSSEGRKFFSENCAEIAPQVPGVVVYSKSGTTEIRTNDLSCVVTKLLD